MTSMSLRPNPAGLSKIQIPDRLCDAPGHKPTVGQDNLVEPCNEFLEPRVLSERDLQVVERFRS
jgi:hypothetical protein